MADIGIILLALWYISRSSYQIVMILTQCLAYLGNAELDYDNDKVLTINRNPNLKIELLFQMYLKYILLGKNIN